MTASQRRELIRERLKARNAFSGPSQTVKGPGLYRAIHPAPLAPKRRSYYKGTPYSGPLYCFKNFGAAMAEERRRKGWVKLPNEVKDELTTKRRQRLSPLTKIAEQLPQKLPKLTWDSLAERICGAARPNR